MRNEQVAVVGTLYQPIGGNGYFRLGIRGGAQAVFLTGQVWHFFPVRRMRKVRSIP